MFIDWLIHTGIELFIICLSSKLFCLIHIVYVTCISFANLLFMFITSVLIENYISTGIIRGFEEYVRIQEDPLRIYLSFRFNRYCQRTCQQQTL